MQSIHSVKVLQANSMTHAVALEHARHKKLDKCCVLQNNPHRSDLLLNLFICDSNPLTMKAWNRLYFGSRVAMNQIQENS